MGLSWTSFSLEIINFLVLVWILKSLFYRPIQKVILERQQAVQSALANAQKLHDEAKELQATYDNRLAEWDLEKSEKRKAFQLEMGEWKSKELAKFEETLRNEKDKFESREKQKLAETIDKNTKEAFALACQFAARFLTTFSDDTLEKKMVAKIASDLSSLPESKKQLLNTSYLQQPIKITSAFSLNDAERKQLTAAIQKIINKDVDILFTQNPQLLAGLTIQIGSLMLKANLRDELKFFADEQHA